MLDTEEGFFNLVANDLKTGMRDWWVPDAEFLSLMRKDQLEAVAVESGAGKLKGSSNSWPHWRGTLNEPQI